MRTSAAALAAYCLLAACDGNPFLVADDPPPGPAPDPVITDPDDENFDPSVPLPNGIPVGVARNLQEIAYDPVAKTLEVTISGIDGTPTAVSYARNLAQEAGLPPGYEAYTIQEDPLDRFFTAIVRESADGNVRAASVSDGGQFNRFFSGGYYERDGAFDAPPLGSGPGAGQVTYTGGYAGLTNFGGTVLPAGPDPSVWPATPGRVVGQVVINANFADMLINGSIFDRQHLDAPLIALDTLVLAVTDIDADGEFFGSVEIEGAPEESIGNYAGIFGGNNAASLGAVILIEEFIDDAILENEAETGVMVLTQCGQPGANLALCAGAAP